MDSQTEKIFVALGYDIEDGFKTLEWTLKKWSSQTISIVILHVMYNISNDFLYTPFGKLPASSMNDQKLQVLIKHEQEKIDKLLCKYISFCGHVKAEVLAVEKCEQPIHKVIMDLIFKHHITKLVMGFTFLKTSSSWRIKNAFYIHNQKPGFCELLLICAGKLVFLRGESNKGVLEDDQGVIVAKLREKASFRGWLANMFHENSGTSPDRVSTDRNSPSSQNIWESHVHEIENYFQHLLSLKFEEDDSKQESDDAPNNPMDSNIIAAENIEPLRTKMNTAQKTIKLKRKEAKANVARRTKAQLAISLCNCQSEKLEAQAKEEASKRAELKKALDSETEQLHEVTMDTKESKSKLSSLMELQFEISNKLQISTLAKSNSEVELEKALSTQAEIIGDIEKLRQQRDVLRRRIEFCKEKDVIGMVGSRLNNISCPFKKYTAEEIRLATNNFSERLRIKPGGDWTSTMCKGRINNAAVAIKILNCAAGDCTPNFEAKVTILSHIRHPHLVSMMGFCTELRCIVFEYMHNGSLRDILLRDLLFSSHISCKKRKRALGWHDRIRIAGEICSGLGFLHTANPPIVHGRLSLSNILLDRNLVTKISGFGLSQSHIEQSVRSDIRAVGVLMMHLLTGRNWAGLGQALKMDPAAVVRDLDKMAGHWPLDLAEKLAGLALTCLTSNRGPRRDLMLATVTKELKKLKKTGDDIVAVRKCEGQKDGDVEEYGTNDVPSFFLCPISQEVMKNPQLGADGFSYELETIEEWLGMGHDTSPMTNLRLKHTSLTANHTLRSLIQDWHNKRFLPPP